MENGFPFRFHPCWANERERVWERIHLPVAPKCNVKCIFCDHQVHVSCHVPKPGAAARIMTPSDSVNRFSEEVKKRPNLHIAAISGPGEPLVNPQTFETFRRIRAFDEDIEFCLSTNGILLTNYVNDLVKLRVRTISVSINTVHPRTAARIYEWAMHGNEKLTGNKMGQWIIGRQFEGIQCAIRHGIMIKANSIIIPGINDAELESLSQTLAEMGIELQNIIPLVPYANLMNHCAPASSEVANAREKASLYIKQFRHCAQCRSDVVGIPGADSIL